MSKLLLAVVYRPPNIGFMDEFFRVFLDLQVDYRHSVIVGDFNADMNQVAYDSQQISAFVTGSGLHLVPFSATHHTRNSSTLLDLCIIDDGEKLIDYGQRGVAFLSAHDLIYIKYAVKLRRRTERVVLGRDRSGFNEEAFVSEVNSIDWTDLLLSANMDEKIGIFNAKILDIYDAHAPWKQFRYKNLPAPWLTTEIRAAMKSRDMARRIWRRRKGDVYYSRFKVLRNQVQNMVRTAKRDYYYKVFSRANGAGEVWGGLRHLGLIKPKGSGSCLSCSVEDLNSFFVREAGLSEIGFDENNIDDICSGEFEDKDFHWEHVMPIMIRRTILRAKSNAIGSDGISIKMLKLVIDGILPILEHLFNFSLMSGEFPSQWRSALVCPIPKIKNPTSVKHYRPISILPALSKILERVACEQINRYLEREDLRDQCQFAYRKNYSTQTCLIRMMDDVRQAVDLRMVTISVFFDFSKAFDRVNHRLLIKKLKELNFSDSTLTWIYSYLSGRTQVVKDAVAGTVSSSSSVKVGVPQGSVLGPLLFTLYLADFGKVLRHCRYNFYADDLQIYLHCEPKNIIHAVKSINDDIDAVLLWSTTNGLILNADKTQAIIMGTSRYINALYNSALPEIRVDGHAVQYLSSVKYLGLVIANNLSWEKQIINTTKRIRTTLYQLKLCKHMFPDILKIRLVTALIFPHIDYCCAAMTDITGEQSLKLYRGVNACVRFIFNTRFDVHISPFYERLSWLKIDSRRLYFVGCLTYNALRTKQPTLLHSNYRQNTHTSERTTRATREVFIQPHCRTETYKRSFRLTSITFWNNLPNDIRHSTSFSDFKQKLYAHLLARQSAGASDT
ncbi:uncharacterized protein LOC114940599 [Nylanderia fulva]|uniref:uncharacterized protein LOC114940599 n=1 Tax=Nylanderia fulva TaxID=613905 RepID=UPI0010FAD18D|nr:uncharacterized protein LOC114940599 [Nylanderia fulva]